MEEEKTSQSCKNCKFYVPYYRQYKTAFHKTSCGHCENTNAKQNKKSVLSVQSGCFLWQPVDENAKQDILPSIYEQLKFLSGRVEELAVILSEALDEE